MRGIWVIFFGGASVYPGGCIIWGPGYNIANAVAEDLGVDKWWKEPEKVTRAEKQWLLQINSLKKEGERWP